MATQSTESDVINGTINRVGVAFGQTLVGGWNAMDHRNRRPRVRNGGLRASGSADVLVYPANFVAKRWERREVNFFEASYGLIAEDVSRLAREHGLKSPSKV
jgi:hypothetical protein